MGLFDDPQSLLPGLKPAHFRGVQFFMPDVTHEVGRRVFVTLFPGIDEASFDDLGRHDGPVRLTGLIIGDDYVTRALALQAALQTAGTGTLLHPWLGEMTVIVADPASIHFSAIELRVVRFDASFRPVSARVPGFASSASRLLGSAAGVLSTLTSFAAATRSGTLAVSTIAAARTTILAGADIITARAASSTGAPDLVQPIDTIRTALDAVVDAVGEGDAVAAFAAQLVALPEPIGTLAAGLVTPAIGSYSGAIATSSLAARAGATLLVDIAAAVREVDAIGMPAAAARLVIEVSALARAVEVAAEISYESRQDAMAWRDLLEAALEQAEADAIALAPLAPGQVAPVLGAVAQLRANLAADLNEIIGRLPPVRVFTLPDVTSAWLIAQHFAGNDATMVVAMYEDIVRRNRLRHPGAVPPEGVEVLA